MYLEGSYIYQRDPVKAARVLFYGDKTDREVILLDVQEGGSQKFTVRSAFKQVGTQQFMALSDEAAKLTTRVNAALRKITRKGGEETMYRDFPAVEFYSKTRNAEVTIVSDRQRHYQVSVDMDIRLSIALTDDDIEKKFIAPPNIPYIELSGTSVTDDGQEITVRTVAEIRLKKHDVSWMDKVTNVVVQDDEAAEELFKAFENYSGAIAYDTETTGLKINCFGKINSSYAKDLAAYNEAHPGAPLRADKLCGIILCNDPNKAYYFPCFSRKFKTLYSEDTPTRRRVIENIKSRYVVGDLHDKQGDMADYVRSGGELTPDIILMERIRTILEKGYIVAHNGSYEYKCGLLYDIVTNIRDDTMLLHQILYRYGPNPAHRRSDLKTLSLLELGIEQWSLDDFFPQYKEDEDSRLRADSQVGKKKKKKGAHIDFSYMELDGTEIYAPADGYCTYQLWSKYKADLKKNWSQMERIYLIEIAACPGVAYCEFYGHRIDEAKIEAVRQDFIESTALLESKVRSEAKKCQGLEDEVRRRLELARMSDAEAEKLSEDDKSERLAALEVGSKQLAQELKEIMQMDAFNIGSSKQLCALFYEEMGIPESSKGKSVAKDAVKAILEHKNPDGSLKYPIAKFYQEYKAADTLLIKFFDNLSDYMYPGGFIFSSYGQIAAATGRMSCIAEGERVSLMEGSKAIEKVRKNDFALCYNSNGRAVGRRVLEVIDQGVRECIEIRYSKQNSKKEWIEATLICTPDHKIRKADGSWVEAGSLTEGKEIAHMSGTSKFSLDKKWVAARVLSVTPVGERRVYDLTIDQFPNFVASGINVHNCRGPNAQQYPKAITKIVVGRQGCVMMDADFSQIEYRVLVSLAKEPGLMKAFYDPDNDYHTLMAGIMYGVDYAAVTPGMRGDAKRFNFGIPYGMGIGSIAMGLFGENTPKTREMAKQKRKLYFKDQPLVEQFFERVKEAAVVYGYTETAFKRRRYYVFTSSNSDKANAAKAAAQRQAGNAVIQGTAADIFKIALARSMRWIVKNGLLGKVFITNMVHDELLFEVNATELDVLKATCSIAKEMSFPLDGYPPLYVGAGVSDTWAKAKGKDAEIHPTLMERLTQESKDIDVHTPSKSPNEWIKWFDERVMAFRNEKVIGYLENEKNFGQTIHPEVGNLIRLLYERYIDTTGVDPKDDAERTLRCVEYLSDKHGLGLDRSHYVATGTSVAADDAEDSEYEDDADSHGEFSDITDSDFEFLDDDKLAGVRLQDLIREFGYVVAPSLKVCGIDDSILTQKMKEDVYGFLLNHKQCQKDDEGALQIVLHIGAGALKYTEAYVRDIGVGAELEALLNV